MKKKDIMVGLLMIIIITSLSGYLLAQVYKVTKPKIDEQKKDEEQKLYREIFPEGVEFTEEKEYIAVYDGEKKLLGRIYHIVQPGYGGPIVIKAGFDTEGKVKGIRILEQSETPGLGAKITEKSFLNQFAGKSGKELYLKKYNKEGTIDAITGATISSKAVSDGIIKIQEKLKAEGNTNETD
ncbi:MAG: RnfABCDGE type electron transport complex subunit G [Candidatus Omnitrophica bacterium]|nr:RnfABCDGE type electron transport complex subunit G [Candidatus Omnitrophota bacterium]MCM8778110.1 RnfABCDGE type electron transport complex subunit G [Candidatus Omnitrophota bacterium]